MLFLKFVLFSAKMNPLSQNREWLVWLSVCSTEKNESRKKKIQRYAFTLATILGIILPLIASVVFFFKFISTNLERALNAISVSIGLFCSLYIIFVALFARQKITEIFDNLSQLYESCKSFFVFNSCEITLDLFPNF